MTLPFQTRAESENLHGGRFEEGGAAGPADDLVLRVVDLAKAFGPTQALRSCTFDLRAGEVHAIMGENGSGKSTLVKILAGVHTPDRGVIEVDGRAVSGIASPRAALDLGIVAVFQEVLVVGPRSVLDNIWLGVDGVLLRKAGAAERTQRARDVLMGLLGVEPNVNTPVEELSLSDRQACCIARALVRRPRVLILDEATSALDVATRGRLFTLVRRFVEEGGSACFISHRMDEIEEIGDRITVMRAGRTVATVARGEATPTDLVRLMTGSERLTGVPDGEREPRDVGEVVLRAVGLRLRPGAQPIDFELRKGEVVGLAGLEGHGQDAFLHALRGAGAAAGKVVRTATSGEATISSPSDATAHGVVYVPRERRLEALFEGLSVRENFALPTLGRDASLGMIRSRRTENRLAEYVRVLGIKLGRSRDAVSTLSGGNQQKVVIARWLAAEPRILLLNDPTRGVDLGAKRDIYRLLVVLAAAGIAVVMLSTEVDEHVELMDRVLVFREDELSTELPRQALTREALVASFFAQQEERGA